MTPLDYTEERLIVTPLGRAELEKLVAAVHAWLAAELADWGAADDTQLATALGAAPNGGSVRRAAVITDHAA